MLLMGSVPLAIPNLIYVFGSAAKLPVQLCFVLYVHLCILLLLLLFVVVVAFTVTLLFKSLWKLPDHNQHSISIVSLLVVSWTSSLYIRLLYLFVNYQPSILKLLTSHFQHLAIFSHNSITPLL